MFTIADPEEKTYRLEMTTPAKFQSNWSLTKETKTNYLGVACRHLAVHKRNIFQLGLTVFFEDFS